MSDIATPAAPSVAPPKPSPEALMIPDWATVRRYWNDIEDELKVSRREYALNRAFDRGDQHIQWNTITASAVIREFATPADTQSRTTVNKFRSRRRQLTARLTSSPLSKEVRLGSTSDSGMRRARLAEHVLEAMASADSGDWERIRAEEVLFTMKGGNAAVCWEWDINGADPPLADPPPTDPYTGLVMPCGGVTLRSLSIMEFGLEPGSRRQQDARFWMRCYGSTPEQVQATYRLPEKPRVDSMPSSSPMSRLLTDRAGSAGRSEQRLTQVTVFTRRPTVLEPGCVAHYVNERLVAYSAWPYPHQGLNLYVFSCDDPDESWLSDPFLSDLRQPQSMYNDVRTTIREHAQRAANARIVVKTGSLPDPAIFTDQPGEVVEYDTESPSWMSPPEVSRWLVGEVSRLDDEINDLAGSPDVSRGVAPGDRNSGSALALLAEKADGPLGPFGKDQARGWSVICTNVLRTLRHHMPPGQLRRTVTYGQGNGVPVVKNWTRDDIDPDVTVVVPVESTMPKSQAALRASLIDMQRSFPQVFQGLDGPTLARMLGMADTRDMMQAIDPDDAFATWENEILATGEAVVPDPWHRHEKHIQRHERFRNSPAYEEAPEQVRQMVDEHIDAHHKMKEEAAMRAAQQQFAMQQAQAGQQQQAQPGAGGEPPAEQAQDSGPEQPIEGTELPPNPQEMQPQ